MAGPWEKYQQPESTGPWNKYQAPSMPSSMAAETGDAVKDITEFASSRDPGIDYATGIKNFGFRAGFSRMSGDEEKSAYLDKMVGPGNWTKDSFGAFVIKPEGTVNLGQKSQQPIALDEQTMSRYDIADILGDAPAMLGGIGAGMAATGLGAPAGIGMAALGAAGGKAIDEIVKNVQGYRRQGPLDIAKDILSEGALSVTGEGFTRALKPIGSFLMGPGARRMTPERQQLMESAVEQGFKPRPGQITDAPILARWEGMVKSIFGDLNKEQNDAAVNEAIKRLTPSTPISPAEAGDAVRTALIGGRKQLAADAKIKYAAVDEVARMPFIPTDGLKKAATEILDSLPKTTEGKPIFASKETVGLLSDIAAMPQQMTASQMQQVRTMLRDASTLKNLTPDLSKNHAMLLRDAADKTFDDAAKGGGLAEDIVRKLREADAFYKAGIAKYDNKLVTAITRDPGKVASIEPELVVDAIIKPGQEMKIARIKSAVPEEAWKKVQGAHSQEIVSALIKNTDDPLNKMFDGRAFKEALDKYKPGVLTAVHGPEWTANAYKLADSLMLVQKSMKASGGIVAANVALHPIINLPKLLWLRGMAKFLQTPGGLHYLTEGIKAPNTRAGAEALTRVATQAALIADDETGSASFTVTNPRTPEITNSVPTGSVTPTQGVRG